MRTWVSRMAPGATRFLRRVNDEYSSAMFMPPVKPTSRSMTRIFLWSRKACHQRSGKRRWKRCTSMPSACICFQKASAVEKEPMASASTHTRTPRLAAAVSACAKRLPVESSVKM